MVDENGRKSTTVAQEELVQGLVDFTIADSDDK
jgi:DNA-directed RNA polymerase subunit K/omega